MPKILRRVLLGLAIVVVILGAVSGGAAYAYTKVLPPQSFPQIDGTLALPGLQSKVDIYRDPLGIPHIYAANQHDLFFAQGYVHAQDRFWQMDFWRHIGSGRLSEMFGKGQLDTDLFLRRMGWARIVEQELAVMDPKVLAIMNAYAAGVNAYLADHTGTALSLEYGVLKLLAPDYKIEPWTPANTLTWAKAMAWDLRGNMDDEGDRAVLLKTFTQAQVDELYPAYPSDHPSIVASAAAEQTSAPQPGGAQPGGAQPGGAQPGGALAADAVSALAAQTGAVQASIAALDSLLGPSGSGIGSNNWVIAGKLTASGKPLLANDPHLSSQMPSIWYEVGLHCQSKGPDCPFDVTGFSFAGAPGVVIGHNDRIAWGFTNVGPDVQDVYIEKINPANPNQYEVNGKWVDMEVRTETVRIAGGKEQTVTIRSTRHGPLLWEGDQEVKDFADQSGLALPSPYRLALRWTALEPGTTFMALLLMDTAQNWDEFRAAAAKFTVPAQNFIYADVDGNIGYQMPGNIPIRAKGNGRTYVPGWTDDYEWTGFIPFAELPHAFNPPEGFIATANNQVIQNYPYLITTDWNYGFRAQRIVDLIQTAPGKIDAAYIAAMQGDNRNLSAEYMLPVLLAAHAKSSAFDRGLAQALGRLQSWDQQQGMDSGPAALYEVFWKHLIDATFNNKLPKDMQADGSDRWWEVLRNLVKQPDSAWWDNPQTSAKETRDETVLTAFADAVKDMQKLQGSDPAKWGWGKLHTLTFQNKTLGKSGVAPIEALFNRGPYPVSGGESIVNATGWDTSKGYIVNWLPSMRMIVDLSDLSKSQAVHTTGQSGHAYNPHYTDMVDLWRTIQYHPMRWNAEDIRQNTEGHLVLNPQ